MTYKALQPVNGKRVIITPTGLKLGSRGKVMKAGTVFATLNKGEARRLRKSLRVLGHPGKAGEPRQN